MHVEGVCGLYVGGGRVPTQVEAVVTPVTHGERSPLNITLRAPEFLTADQEAALSWWLSGLLTCLVGRGCTSYGMNCLWDLERGDRVREVSFLRVPLDVVEPLFRCQGELHGLLTAH